MQISGIPSNNENDFLISVKGRFDFNAAPLFRDTYEKTSTQPKCYIIDLKEAEYLDSTALGVLLSLREHAIRQHSAVKIINCNKDVAKILNVTKLDQLFLIE